MPFNKPWFGFIHPADVKAAQSAVEEISKRIQTEKDKVKASGDKQDIENEILENLKKKLAEFSQENPSEAMALLKQLKIKYPKFPWEG
jgi:hypothetical protein